ncbi:hypothetical protein KIF53_02080 [Chromobacterium subtsugae]|uniref:Uncharacterized protein n=1 Tax=Chromobacterium subtsugae TaxID=251747 RepID=A0ABS7F8Q4_9NEIS|nr:hypothetical protein [Chromobacterium subtsugae]MBW8286427.1 hypothetical protein [Chromobacterium subtsugae]
MKSGWKPPSSLICKNCATDRSKQPACAILQQDFYDTIENQRGWRRHSLSSVCVAHGFAMAPPRKLREKRDQPMAMP